ncbi:hypothetical protein B7P33_17200 [Sediminicola luteus]|uniref:Uncharacterized protein n=1 Tax=Sediminicola luteus TaxID=319238 RepID=A0A2A4G3K2_9FLAO|nr:hypothetical protein B7P33_17200 [Sediminicola luteus]
MRTFGTYKGIREGARIWGLDLLGFAWMMASIVLSLIILIFSFGIWLFLSLVVWNLMFYLGLGTISHYRWGDIVTVGPFIYSNRKGGLFHE